MQKKILVAYASKCGSTAEIADVIGQVLHEQGASVDVSPVDKVTDISEYQAIVVGSAIRMGKCLSEAKKFVQTHQKALQEKSSAYFAVCLSLHEDSDEKRREAEHYLDALREMAEPQATAVFAGKMDFSRLSFLDRMIVKMVKSPEGDFRTWEVIRVWAASLAVMFA